MLWPWLDDDEKTWVSSARAENKRGRCQKEKVEFGLVKLSIELTTCLKSMLFFDRSSEAQFLSTNSRLLPRPKLWLLFRTDYESWFCSRRHYDLKGLVCIILRVESRLSEESNWSLKQQFRLSGFLIISSPRSMVARWSKQRSWSRLFQYVTSNNQQLDRFLDGNASHSIFSISNGDYQFGSSRIFAGWLFLQSLLTSISLLGVEFSSIQRFGKRTRIKKGSLVYKAHRLLRKKQAKLIIPSDSHLHAGTSLGHSDRLEGTIFSNSASAKQSSPKTEPI